MHLFRFNMCFILKCHHSDNTLGISAHFPDFHSKYHSTTYHWFNATWQSINYVRLKLFIHWKWILFTILFKTNNKIVNKNHVVSSKTTNTNRKQKSVFLSIENKKKMWASHIKSRKSMKGIFMKEWIIYVSLSQRETNSIQFRFSCVVRLVSKRIIPKIENINVLIQRALFNKCVCVDVIHHHLFLDASICAWVSMNDAKRWV